MKSISSLLLAAVVATVPLSADSLWRKGEANGSASMYADKKARTRGDIVTIVIGESASMLNSVSLTTEKDSSVANNLQQFLFSSLLQRNGETPATDLTLANNEHTGGGTIDNSSTLNARVSVMVTDTLPNGNLVLEGVKRVSYSNETYYIVTRGICRPYDIASDNTVHSSEVAEAQIEVVSEGTLTESQRKGFATRAFDRWSP